LKIWDPELPAACVADHHQAEPWRCFFGHRLYNTLKCELFATGFLTNLNSTVTNSIFIVLFKLTAPLFVFQWLFDEAQMRADSVGAPVTPQQWDYIHDMGGALRASLVSYLSHTHNIFTSNLHHIFSVIFISLSVSMSLTGLSLEMYIFFTLRQSVCPFISLVPSDRSSFLAYV
jgi:hypothetical protein